MQNLIYSIFIILCVTICLNGEEITPIPNSARLLPRTLSDNYCSENDQNTWKCIDCNSVQYCDGSTSSPETTFNCDSQFPGRPYCNKAARNISEMCVSDESVCDPDPMECPAEGIFPSLTNCKAYHLCLSKGGCSIPYFCKQNTVYNHASKSCRFNSPCYTVTSECGYQNKIIPYRLDNSLYCICRGYGSTLLKMCPKGLVFDSAEVKCTFKCPAEGAFANPLDCKSYYMCYLDGDVLRKEQICCPNGAEFDDKKKHCVGNIVTNITSTSRSTSTST